MERVFAETVTRLCARVKQLEDGSGKGGRKVKEVSFAGSKRNEKRGVVSGSYDVENIRNREFHDEVDEEDKDCTDKAIIGNSSESSVAANGLSSLPSLAQQLQLHSASVSNCSRAPVSAGESWKLMLNMI